MLDNNKKKIIYLISSIHPSGPTTVLYNLINNFNSFIGNIENDLLSGNVLFADGSIKIWSAKKFKDDEKKDKQSGVSFKIAFDEKYQNEYNELLKDKENIKKETKTELLNKSIKLESGSILIMDGATQKYFCHSIDKEDTTNNRYSLTFRQYE